MLDTHARRLMQPTFDWTAARFERARFSADAVTLAAFVVGAAAGPLIGLGEGWLGAGALWLSGFLDAVDGTLARRARPSAWGATMDLVFDRLVEVGVVLGLAYRYPGATWPLLLLLGSWIFSLSIFFTVGALSKELERKSRKAFYYQAGLAERTEGFILLTLMTLVPGHLVALTYLFLVVETFTALQRLREAYGLFAQAGERG